LLDRIDLHIEVPAVPYQELRSKDGGASSSEMRGRVAETRGIQQARGFNNSNIPVQELRKLCALDDAGERTLEMAVRKMGLSARAHDRILKVARTVADLDHSERVAIGARRLGLPTKRRLQHVQTQISTVFAIGFPRRVL
jgi:magnesium chelatase family protein